ncbi:MAG TPA: hypothetical protein VHT34_03295 [Clostridia bacterium]|nr:hypothetical protein [Clostridia bacterium]
MQNHKKQDSLSVNKISETNEVKSISNITGDAAEDPFCIYDHKRHAVGSRLKNEDGSEAVCKDDGTWRNK